MRVVVAGYLVRGPLGGLAWHHLQYAVGLHRLGHDVLFYEDSDDFPGCYDPARGVTEEDPSYGLRFAAAAFGAVGLGERWCYHDAHTGAWHGPAAQRARAFCADAELLLNLSGVNPLRDWLAAIPARALVDTDPVFTQIAHLDEADRREEAARHTAFLTFAANTGGLPDDGFAWRPTRQPVVLDAWPATEAPAGAPFSTVMQWRSYPPREHDGVRYGMKADAFRDYLELPARAGEAFVLALGGEFAPRRELRDAGWVLADPLAVTRDLFTYQDFIAASAAEFSVAKHGYVAGRTGWFSERSAAYLASGRPVLVQETGFSDWLPTGTGAVAFSTLEEAAAGALDIRARYAEHARAAREIAAAHFDHRRVLPELLEIATSAPVPS